jgi:periplasmic mercuric ion binding protein
MKSLSIYAAIIFSMFTTNALAQSSVKKDTIKIWGNCGMCKTTIEKAAKKAGAKKANWNEDTKQLTVAYIPTKSSTQKIQQAIANVGYDTQDFTADDKVYNKLHGCCQYERKSKN